MRIIRTIRGRRVDEKYRKILQLIGDFSRERKAGVYLKGYTVLQYYIDIIRYDTINIAICINIRIFFNKYFF